MNHREIIANTLAPILSELRCSLSHDEIEGLIEVPRDSSHGDLAFPCFPLAKELKKAPQQISADLIEKIVNPEGISDVKALGPYLNFVMDRNLLAHDILPKILGGSYLAKREDKGVKVMVEYSQPNTHKALHVGHSRCATMGDSFVRIFEWSGFDTVPANYLGDEGTHVARCLWYYTNHFSGDIPTENRGEFLGGLYAKAVQLVSLSSMTKAPLPGVVATKVVRIESHPNEENLKVLVLETTNGEETVVCGGIGYSEGDIVAHAGPSTRVNDRPISSRAVKGVESAGMICSETELGIGNEKNKIAILPNGTAIGEEVAEIYSLIEEPVLKLWKKRNDEVGKVLADIESGGGETYDLWKETRQWSIDDFMDHYDWLRCRFDHWFYESEFGESSKAMVSEYQDRGIFEKSDGAVGADLTSDDLGFVILTKSNGTATYASRDLVLAKKKFEEFNVDRSIYVVDEGQSLHFKQVFKCLEKMGYEKAKDCYHHGYGVVALADPSKDSGFRQISSRAGDTSLFTELRNGLEDRVKNEFLVQYKNDWDEDEINHACHALALSAIRYGMLRQSNDSMIIFDLDRWTEAKGETGPYLLYVYARIQSIKRKTGLKSSSSSDWSLLTHETEQNLIATLAEYHAAIDRACSEYAPNHLCSFAYDLCKNFNRFFRDCSIKNAENEELQIARLSLADAVGLTLSHCLSLLGIEVIDRM